VGENFSRKDTHCQDHNDGGIALVADKAIVYTTI